MSAVPTQNEANAADSQEVAEMLSAFMDSEAELPVELLASAAAREQWATYHLIGDVLRSEELAFHVSPAFSQRLAAALEAEPHIVAARRRPALRVVTRYALPGVALAAAVAAVTWMAQPLIAPGGHTLQASSSQAEGTFTAASLGAKPVLIDYLDAHRHTAGFNLGAESDLGVGLR